MRPICEFFAAIVADPKHPDVVREAHARATEIFEHLDHCENCQKRDIAEADAEAFYQLLVPLAS